jgi:hypothetical protein
MSPNPPGRLYEVAARQRAALLRGERQAASELMRAYGGVWQHIQVRLDALWQAKAAAEADGGAVDTSWLYQFNRLDTLQRQVEAELRTFAEFADPLITRQQAAAVDAALRDAESLVRTATHDASVTVGWAQLPTAAIEELVGFTANGSPLRELLDALGPAASSSVRDALIQGLALGRGPAAVAREIRQALGGNVVRALRISRTETLRAYREATRRSYEANSDVVDGWIWNCACTERSCALCWAMHGTVHPNTESLNDHPNGRCAMLPHVKDFPGMAPQTLPEPGPAQFARLTPVQQDGILGQAAGRAYRAGAFELKDVVARTFDPDWGPGFRVKSLRELVGQEEAQEFTRWAPACQRGNETILRVAQEIAQRHGVLADYAGDAQVAELMTDALLRLRHDEWLPRQISVDAEWFPVEVRRTRVASFDPESNVLLINSKHEYWRLSPAERREWAAYYQREGYLATADTLHPIWHELGHSALWQTNRIAYVGVQAIHTKAQRLIAFRVSKRAAVRPTKFMSEVFAAILGGRSLPADVLALYKTWGGPLP